MTETARSRGAPFVPSLSLVLWALYLAAWSALLLTPNPGGPMRRLIPEEYRFLTAKVIHVSAYAGLAVLSGWLGVAPRLRLPLALLLLAHAFGTEYLQQFVSTRTPAWRDVGLNCLGLALGAALTWKWWLADGTVHRPPRAAAARAVPQPPAAG